MRTAAILAAFLLSSAAAAGESSLVVAGHGASLEDALLQPHAPNFRLLVLREELLRLRGARADDDVLTLLKGARREGAVVFVCERDLRAEHLERSDLVPGVVSVAASTDWVNGTPSAADVKLRTLCS